MKVLVVLGNPALRRSLKQILESEGHVVVTAGDGLQALHALEEVLDFELLILGNHFPTWPNISGLQVLEFVRDDTEPYAAIRVIFYSTGSHLADAVRRLGADFIDREMIYGEQLLEKLRTAA